MKILILTAALASSIIISAQEPPASMTPLGHQAGIFEQNATSPILSVDILNEAIICNYTTSPVPMPQQPVYLSSMTSLYWGGVGDLPDCFAMIGDALKAVPPYTAAYTARMRSYGIDSNQPNSKVWGNWSSPSNAVYQPPPSFTMTCPTVTPVSAIYPATTAPAYWQNPTTNGGVTPVQSSCSPSSGSPFPLGKTIVGCNASDNAQRAATCSMEVQVTQTPPPQPQPPQDTQAPENSITVRRSGNSSNYSVTATVSDDVRVVRVEYLLDGLLKSFQTAPPWNSVTIRIDARGSHVILVKAMDAAGNIGPASQTIIR